MPKSSAVPRFVFRARYWGALHWICPYSGHLNFSRVEPKAYRVVCSGGGCGRRFIPGVVMWGMPPGKHSIPPDWIIPVPADEYFSGDGLSESIPMGDLAIMPWRRHTPTHVLMRPDSDDADAGEYNVRAFVRQVRVVAETLSSSDTTANIAGLTPMQRLAMAFEIVANAVG